jgi:class 3 adenylate cyclase
MIKDSNNSCNKAHLQEQRIFDSPNFLNVLPHFADQSRMKNQTVKQENHRPESWFRRPSLGIGKIVACTLLTALVFIWLHQSEVGWQIEQHSMMRVNFSARESLGNSVEVSPKLKIIVFDDIAERNFQSDGLTGSQWVNLINKIGAARPASIIIDKRFAGKIIRDDERQSIVNALKSAGNASALGVVTTSQAVVSASGDSIVAESSNQLLSNAFENSSTAALSREQVHILGPHPAIRDGFRWLGHGHVNDFGYYRPYYRLGNGGALLHIALTPFSDVSFNGTEVSANGAEVPVDRHGNLVPNFIKPEDVARKGQLISVYQYLFADAERMRFKIEEGDHVLIFLGYFTGGTDFKSTPAGKMIGGMLIGSVLNSALTHEWVRWSNFNPILILLASILSAILAWKVSRGVPFVASIAIVSIVITLTGLQLFAQSSLVLPWMWINAAFITNASILFLERTRVREMKALLLKNSLSDKLSPFHIQKLLGDPPIVDTHAYQRNVTLMFIDVVGYSKYAERFEPEDVFARLRSLMSELTLLVYDHKGSVNNSFGDGLLAIFGYDFDGKESHDRHANDALNCAIAIQKHMVLRNFEASRKDEPIHPLRIGINTGIVCIGDLADDDRFNFTVIGHPVNYAKRLEESCEFYRIMFSESTKNALKEVDINTRSISSRLVLIKHHDRPLEAFEYDPLVDDPELTQVVQKQYWKFAGIAPKENRINVPGSIKITVKSNYGAGFVINFSRFGMAANMVNYLANGMTLEFSLDTPDGTLKDMLEKANLGTIVAEVRWGSKSSDHYQHGLMFRSLSETQKEYLYECLTEVLVAAGRSRAS